VEAILKSVQETAAMSETEALKLEFEIGWPIFSTNDSKEGPRAFAEKRTPNWTRT
jgi:enoyl-CoA hydratase